MQIVQVTRYKKISPNCHWSHVSDYGAASRTTSPQPIISGASPLTIQMILTLYW